MKKHHFSNSFYFLLAIVAIVMCASGCQKSEQTMREEIRKEVENEYAQMFDSLLQTPKNFLTNREIETVAKSFSEIPLKDSVETLAYKFEDGREVMFNGKFNDPSFFTNFGGIKKELYWSAALDLQVHPSISKVLRDRTNYEPQNCVEANLPDTECIVSGGIDKCQARCQSNSALLTGLCNAKCEQYACPLTKTLVCGLVLKGKGPGIN